jgi:signal transduction histidine kinase
MSFIWYTQTSYLKGETRFIEEQSKLIATQVGLNLRQRIYTRVRVLMALQKSQADVYPRTRDAHNRIAKAVYDNVSGFLAINWITPDGVIKWIYPDNEENQKAAGKNVMEKDASKHFLIHSRHSRQPELSSLIPLYQGADGFIIYIPIYTNDDVFRGWFNGVIKYKEFMDVFFERQELKNIRVRISWEDYKDSVYQFGNANFDKPNYAAKFKILNQSFRIDVVVAQDRLAINRRTQANTIFLFSYFVILAFTYLFYRNLKTQMNLTKANSDLKMDKTIISILSHDIAAPLTLISENALRLKEKCKDPYPEIDRIIHASDKQKELLKKVRQFHAAKLGKIKLDLLPQSIKEIVYETLAIYESQLKRKNISYKIEIPTNLPMALTDHTTAVHNVLGNVLSNAIKFSVENSSIEISAHEKNSHVILEVKDYGRGIPKEVLRNLLNEDYQTSTLGTLGEPGTGLGMIQIQAFMQYYGGQVNIVSDHSGTTVQLYFLATVEGAS